MRNDNDSTCILSSWWCMLGNLQAKSLPRRRSDCGWKQQRAACGPSRSMVWLLLLMLLLLVIMSWQDEDALLFLHDPITWRCLSRHLLRQFQFSRCHSYGCCCAGCHVGTVTMDQWHRLPWSPLNPVPPWLATVEPLMIAVFVMVTMMMIARFVINNCRS